MTEAPDVNIDLTADEYTHIMALLEQQGDNYSNELADKLFVRYHDAVGEQQ